MEWIRQKLDKIKEPFSPGSKYEKFAPAINALDTFLYTPNHTTKKGAHIRDAVDLKRVMITVVWYSSTRAISNSGPDPGLTLFVIC